MLFVPSFATRVARWAFCAGWFCHCTGAPPSPCGSTRWCLIPPPPFDRVWSFLGWWVCDVSPRHLTGGLESAIPLSLIMTAAVGTHDCNAMSRSSSKLLSVVCPHAPKKVFLAELLHIPCNTSFPRSCKDRLLSAAKGIARAIYYGRPSVSVCLSSCNLLLRSTTASAEANLWNR